MSNTDLAEQPHYLTPAQVGHVLGRTTQRVYQMIWDGELPNTKIAGRHAIPRQAFEQWLHDRDAEAQAAVRHKETVAR